MERIHTRVDRSVLGMTSYLGKAVRSGLEDDQKDSYGHGYLLQLQVVSHPGPAQHAAHAVPSRHSNLPQTDGQRGEFGW